MELKDELLALLRDETKDLWDEEDRDFLKQLAADVVRQKALAASSDDPTVHEENLRHLAATIQGEIVLKLVRVNRKGRELLGRILGAIIRAVAMHGLGGPL